MSSENPKRKRPKGAMSPSGKGALGSVGRDAHDRASPAERMTPAAYARDLRALALKIRTDPVSAVVLPFEVADKIHRVLQSRLFPWPAPLASATTEYEPKMEVDLSSVDALDSALEFLEKVWSYLSGEFYARLPKELTEPRQRNVGPDPSVGPGDAQQQRRLQLAWTCHVLADEIERSSRTRRQLEKTKAEADAEGRYTLTVTEAAALAKCSTSSISHAIESGALKCNGEKGKARRLNADDVELWNARKGKGGPKLKLAAKLPGLSPEQEARALKAKHNLGV